MKVYITRNALTKGIIETEGEMFTGPRIDDIRTPLGFYCGGDWHRTKEDAIQRAEAMRDRRIQSLKEQIKKLEDLKFQ